MVWSLNWDVHLQGDADVGDSDKSDHVRGRLLLRRSLPPPAAAGRQRPPVARTPKRRRNFWFHFAEGASVAFTAVWP